MLIPNKKKPPLRIVSVAWGLKHLNDLLEIALPAVLAPENLPALIEEYCVELVIVTDTKMFNYCETSAVVQGIKILCDFKLIALDDLIPRKDSYGMSLTYAFIRGFEDLQDRAKNYWILFLHSDFILADGSYKGLLPYLKKDKNLIYSPSYCVAQESVLSTIKSRFNSKKNFLSILPREMANLIIKNRHLSIKAKTINQNLFSIDYIEQFYLMVNSETLLTSQFPAALVAMKPEQMLKEPTSYWDYGVIQDFCPSMSYEAIINSDDYLAMELREKLNPKGVLNYGWHTQQFIANNLLSVITDYTETIGKIIFCVHSEEIPDDIEFSKIKLRKYVSSILEKLPRPLPSHYNHAQWTYHYDDFIENKKNYKFNATPNHFVEPNGIISSQQQLETLNQKSLAPDFFKYDLHENGDDHQRDKFFNQHEINNLTILIKRFFENLINLDTLIIKDEVNYLQNALNALNAKGRLTTLQNEAENLIDNASELIVKILSFYDNKITNILNFKPDHEISNFEKLIRKPLNRFHWFYEPSKSANTFLNDAIRSRKSTSVLLISSEFGYFAIKDIKQVNLKIIPIEMLTNYIYCGLIKESYDVIIIELWLKDFIEIKKIINYVKNLLNKNGEIISFLINDENIKLPNLTPFLANEIFIENAVNINAIYYTNIFSGISYRLRNKISSKIRYYKLSYLTRFLDVISFGLACFIALFSKISLKNSNIYTDKPILALSISIKYS